jgi:hypothetical protein
LRSGGAGRIIPAEDWPVAHNLEWIGDDTDLIVAAMSRFVSSDAARAALAGAVDAVRPFGRGQRLLAEGALAEQVSFLCEGMAKCYRTLPDGGATDPGPVRPGRPSGR